MNVDKSESDSSLTSQIPWDNQRVIYEYVQTNGPVSKSQIRETLFGRSERAFEYSLAQLDRHNLVEIESGMVRVRVELQSLGKPKTVELSDLDSPVKIRPARQQDRTDIIETMREVAGDGTHVGAESVAQCVESEGQLLRQDAGSVRVFFVATLDEEIVGWTHLTTSPCRQLGHTAQLTVGVVERCRNAGLGSQLLDRGLEWATKQGYEKVYQQIPASNQTALDFLEKHGWDIEAKHVNRYRQEKEYVDEILCAISLDT